MSDQNLERESEELTLDESELLEEVLNEFGESRRKFLGQTSTAAMTALVLEFVAKRNAFGGSIEGPIQAPVTEENAVSVTFRVNGIQKQLTLDSRVTLLDALRE